MCGRFALAADRAYVRRALPDAYDWHDEDAFVPRYNIAPRTYAPVLRRDRDRDGAAMLHSMRWGLVPNWSTVEDKSLSTTNARAENLVDNTPGMWAAAKRTNRCVVPCQGYYEWLTKGKDKFPHFVKHKDGQMMLMAGLYDRATIDNKELWTFAIVTTDACPEMSWLHDRQPVILSSKEAVDTWLDPSTRTWTPALTELVQPYTDHERHPFECYQVPKEVGRVGTESPLFIEPVKDRKDGIQAMFRKQVQAAKRKRSADDEGEDEPNKPPRTTPPLLKTQTPPPSPRKRTRSPKKATPVPDKGKITAFFSKR
ncbi:hypothetical protein APHAL10511_000858 [Amanita phalloides]|nr:hypothetical protein APHAL10511_000858 [Amanita phalloides]